MQSRKLYQLMKEVHDTDLNSVSNSLAKEIEFTGKEVAQELLKSLNSIRNTGSVRIGSHFQLLEKTLYLDFIEESSSRVYLNISASEISLGFSRIITNTSFNQEFPNHFDSIISRYFNHFEITRNTRQSFEVNSEHRVGIRNLNSRDFYSYASFILNHGIELSSAIFRMNLGVQTSEV